MIEARKRLEDAVPTLEKVKETGCAEKQERTLQAGDEVKVLSWGQKERLWNE